MAAGASRKISAASARAHTRKSKQTSSFKFPSGMLKKLSVVLLIGFLAWAYQAIKPPPPKICGSTNGPPVTATRIKLSDGRYLAYKESGVPKDNAKYKIVFIHGIDSCRHDIMPVSQEVIEELGVYFLSFDRAGYGESDPNPNRSEKSTAFDIEELADQLDLGKKFYVIGFSMGGQAVWGCLKYIPHRLAGAVLIAPAINYWWPGFPSNLSREVYNEKSLQKQWALRITHYAPWLTYWLNTQKWFPASSVPAHRIENFSPQDRLLLPKIALIRKTYEAQIRQQGDFESLYRDMMVGLGNWEFDPMDLGNPFPNTKSSVHLWQGDEDRLVPVALQRYIAKRLPWIQYHEVPGAGHMFKFADGASDSILKTLLLGEQLPSSS